MKTLEQIEDGLRDEGFTVVRSYRIANGKPLTELRREKSGEQITLIGKREKEVK